MSLIPISSSFLRYYILLCLFLVCIIVPLQAQPTISTFSPARNTTASVVSDNIVLTWSQAMSTATLTSGTIHVHGSMSGSYTTNAAFSYSGGNTMVTIDPMQNFKPGELISVSVTNAQNAVGVAMPHSAVWSFLAAAQGSGNFFSTAANYAVGINPVSVEIGDFNRDGILDLVVANSGSNNVSVLFGTGSGTFGLPTDYTTATGASIVRTGDLDGDGDLDLVVSNFGSSLVSVLLNDGSGNFGAATNLNVGGPARSVALGDFDGDGDLDLVAAHNTFVASFRNNGSGSFSFVNNYSAANAGAYNVETGDFDSDGDLDLVVTDQTPTSNVIILLNNGSGVFAVVIGYNSGVGPYSMRTGDLSGDGRLDIVSANAGGSNVVVFRSNGPENWDGPGDYVIGGGPSVETGDFNGDGLLDVAASSSSSSTVTILLNDGTGSVNSLHESGSYAVGNGPVSVRSGDFDGDGRLDIVTANASSNTISVMLNIVNIAPVVATNATVLSTDEDTPLPISVTLSDAESATSALVVTITSSNQSIIRNNAVVQQGATAATTQFLLTPVTNANGGPVNITVRVSDVGGLFSTTTFTITVLSVNDAPSVTTSIFLPGQGEATRIDPSVLSAIDPEQSAAALVFTITSVPVNGLLLRFGVPVGNGETFTQGDINSGSIYYQHNGSNTAGDSFAFSVSDGVGGETQGILTIVVRPTISVFSPARNTTASVVSDNIVLTWSQAMSTATLTSGTIHVHGSMSGSYTTNIPFSYSTNNTVVTIDPVQNFKPGELITVSVSNAHNAVGLAIAHPLVWSFLAAAQSAEGVFSTAANYAVGINPVSVEIGDFNRDGILDLVVANSGSNNVSVLFGTGSGTFGLPTDYTTATGASVVRTGDLDGDGDLDLVVSNFGSSLVSVLLNDGSGNFGAATNLNVGGPARSVALGDFDGDGDLDLVAAHNTFVASFRNNGSGSFSFVNNYSAANAGAYNVETGDFDSDGDLDLVVTDQTPTSNVIILLNNGSGAFAVVIGYNSGVGPYSMRTGDLSGDGRLDIVSANAGGSNVVVFRSNGPENWDGPGDYVIGGGPSVETGDFNGDGLLDVAASSSSSSTVTILLNDGTGSVNSLHESGSYAVGNGPVSVRSGDFDGDGRLDIVTANASSNTISVMLNNTAPIIGTNATVLSFNEDSSLSVSISLSDAESGASALIVTATSSNVSLVQNSRIVQQGATAATTQFLITPVTNANGGPVSITVTATDPRGLSSSTTFILTILPVNDAPTVSTTQTAVMTNEDSATTLTISVADVDNSFGSLTVTATSSNQSLIPNGSITQSGSTGASTSFVLTPASNMNGTAQVTVTVSDGQLSATTIFTVTVLPVNDAPTVSTSQTAVTTNEDSATTLTISVADVDNSFGSLTVTATSSNQSLIPNGSITQSGSTGASTSFVLTPASNMNGTAQVTVTVSDGQLSATTIFTVTVLPVNDAPTVSTTQTAVTTNEDSATTLTVSINDIDNSIGSLVVTATSSNQSLIPNGSIIQNGSTGASTSFALTPASNMNGTAQVTVTVSDGQYSATTMFTVTVLPVNDAPTVSTTQTILTTPKNIATTLSVSVSDIDNSYTQLTVSGTSDNQTLVPNGGIAQNGSTGATTGFIVTPGLNQVGVAHITVTVSDGQYSATTILTLTVNESNIPPTVSTTQTAVTMNEDTAAALIVAVSDLSNTFGELIITATSGNQSLISNGSIAQQGSTSSMTIFTVTPTGNASGTAQVTVTVSDGQYSATTIFIVTVLPVNDVPTVSTTQTAVMTNEDTSTTLTISVADVDNSIGSLVVTATSSNQSLIPNGSIIQNGSTGASTSFVLTPTSNMNGTAQVTVTVSDGQYSATTIFTVTVLPVNDAPMVSTTQTAVTTNEDSATTLSVSVADVDNSFGSLTVTATSSNQSLIPNGNIIQNGTTETTTFFTLTPAPNMNGTAQVTVTVSDGQYSATTMFTVTVLPVNDAPTVSTTQTARATLKNIATTLSVSVSDIDNSYTQLTVSGTSDNQTLVPNAGITQSGSTGATTEFIVTPALNQVGVAHITVTVSDGQYSATTILTLTVNESNIPPTVSTTQTAVTMNEDTAAALIVAVSDLSNTFGELIITATSGNQSLISNGSIVQQGSTSSMTIFTVTPTGNASGTAQVTVTVSDGQYSATTIFTVTVLPVNDAPTVSTTQTAVTTNEDSATTLSVSINDIDNSIGSLAVTATSSNQSLIPNGSITQSGSTGASTSFALTPASNMNGTAQVTVTVSDGQYSATTIFTVTVLPVNDVPTVSTTQTAVTTNEDSATTLTISVADVDNSFGSLTVTATSSNQSLIPNGSIIQNGSTGASTSFVLTPASNMNGTAQVTITVSDGQYSATTIFTVTVLPVNDVPTVSTTQTAVTTNEDSATTLSVSINDIDNSIGSLVVTATSSNQSLIPNGSIIQSGSTGASTSFALTPASNMNGTAQVTITVSDGQLSATTIFTVTVLPVNDAPTVSTSQTAVVTNEDSATTLSVSINDIDNSIGSLVVTATSSNQSLIPNGSIIQNGSTGASTSFALTPASNVNGTAQVTITVSDGQLSATTIFTVTVLPVNDVPTVSTTQTARATLKNIATTLSVSVSDIDNSYAQLTVSGTSDNQTLVPNGGITQSGSTGATTGFIVTPGLNQVGVAHITVTVSDGQYSATTILTLTVNESNIPPTVSTSQTAVMTNEDSATTLTISVADVDNSFGSLTVTATSSNQSLIPNGSIIQNGTTGTTTFFTLTPASNMNGTAQVTITVSDGQYSATTMFIVTVLPVNDVPTVSTTQTAVMTNEDSATTLSVSINDIDNSIGSLAVTATSSNQSLIPNGSITQSGSTGASTSFALTPTSNMNGTAQVTVTVSDGQYSATTMFIVTVLPVNDVPTVSTTQTAVTTNEDTSTTLTISVADVDNSFGSLTVTATSSNQSLIPNGSIIQNGSTGASTSFVLTPASNMNGTAQVTVTVSDGQYSATTIFTVTVLPVNDAPTVSTSQTAVTTNEDSATTLSVSVADVDNSFGSLTVTATSSNQSLIPNGSIIQNGSTGASTSFVLTPTSNMNGTAQVTVTVSDAQYSATTRFTVTVLPINDMPIAVSDRDTICSGSVRTIMVLGNDSDIENNTLMITSVTQGSKGSVSIVNGNTAVQYASVGNASGDDTFSYTISDGNGGFSTATVSMYIRSPLTANAGADRTICLGGATQLSGSGTSAGGSLQFSWSPIGGLSNPTIPNPIVSTSATTTYTLTVTDGFGCTTSDEVTIMVAPAMVISISSRASICAGGSTQLVATGGVSYSWSPVTGLNNPNIANPVASPGVTTTYTVVVTNAGGCSGSTSVTVSVNPLPVANAGNDVTVCVGQSVQLLATGGVSYSWSPATGLDNPNIANPVASPVTTTTYTVTVTNVNGCSSTDAVVVSKSLLLLNVTAILEGAYQSGTMGTMLVQQGLVPTSQPYSGSPFNYGGSESTGSVGSNVVDWMLVELRTSDMSTVSRKAVFLRSDGKLVGSDGGSVLMNPSGGSGSYYIVLRHRNHLAIMSSVQVSVDGSCGMSWNFTGSQSQAYQQFATAMKQVGSGVYGMMTGDVNADGVVNATDRVEVRNDTGATGYVSADVSLDGIVNATDRVLVRNNSFMVSQVP